ncbi:MAG: HPF/RaiA family ribosome-associated protein [Candidatus Rokuibacteriota bacterium]
MQVIISGRGVVLTPTFKAMVERKIGKLSRLRPAALDARVVCEAKKIRRTVRLTVRARRRSFAGVATAGDLLAAVDAAVAAVRRQVSEDKDRRRPSKGRGGVLGLIEPVA